MRATNRARELQIEHAECQVEHANAVMTLMGHRNNYCLCSIWRLFKTQGSKTSMFGSKSGLFFRIQEIST